TLGTRVGYSSSSCPHYVGSHACAQIGLETPVRRGATSKSPGLWDPVWDRTGERTARHARPRGSEKLGNQQVRSLRILKIRAMRGREIPGVTRAYKTERGPSAFT